MSYTPVKTITQTGMSLTESTDLTQLLSSFLATKSYLVVKNTYGIYFTISLSSILTFVAGVDITQPVGTGLNSLLTDLFVTRYNIPGIPIAGVDGYYSNRIRVYNPISYKDCTVSFTSVNTPTVINESVLRGTLDDLSITSLTEDLSNSLVAVNGVFHKTVYLNNTLYVLDGFRTMRIAPGKDMTLVDTSRIGGHTTIPLTSSNVSLTTYNGRAIITLPSPITNRTVCLVVDGYLYHLDLNVLDFLDETHIAINMNLLPLIQQFRHNPRVMHSIDRYGVNANQSSTKYTDSYETLFLNNNYIPTSTFETVEFQLSRLTAFHSFLVMFNTPNIFTIERVVTPTGTPRFYYDYSTLPLSGMASYGCSLCPSYLIHQETNIRRQIFISSQDNDIDTQNQSYEPSFILPLTSDPVNAANIPMRFVDYVTG